MARGGGRVGPTGDGVFGEDRPDRRVERQPPRLDELHDRQRRDRLRQRADHERRRGRDGPAGVIGDPERVGIHHGPSRDDDHRRAGDARVAHLVVEPGVDLGRGGRSGRARAVRRGHQRVDDDEPEHSHQRDWLGQPSERGGGDSPGHGPQVAGRTSAGAPGTCRHRAWTTVDVGRSAGQAGQAISLKRPTAVWTPPMSSNPSRRYTLRPMSLADSTARRAPSARAVAHDPRGDGRTDAPSSRRRHRPDGIDADDATARPAEGRRDGLPVEAREICRDRRVRADGDLGEPTLEDRVRAARRRIEGVGERLRPGMERRGVHHPFDRDAIRRVRRLPVGQVAGHRLVGVFGREPLRDDAFEEVVGCRGRRDPPAHAPTPGSKRRQQLLDPPVGRGGLEVDAADRVHPRERDVREHRDGVRVLTHLGPRPAAHHRGGGDDARLERDHPGIDPHQAMGPRSTNRPKPRRPTNAPSRTTAAPRTNTDRTAPSTSNPSYGV